MAREFQRIPTWKRLADKPNSYTVADLATADHIALLLDWWEASGYDEFARLAANLAAKPVSGFDSWRDGTDLIELIGKFRRDEYLGFPLQEEILVALEDGVTKML